VATRQLASRARRRVRGGDARTKPDLARQREVASAFLTALQNGDFEGLLAILDPDVLVRTDIVGPSGAPMEQRGAVTYAKQATAYAKAGRLLRLAIVDGTVGVVLAPKGRLQRALRLTIANDTITEIEVIGDAERLGKLELSVVD
jgi:hypothetical protein